MKKNNERLAELDVSLIIPGPNPRRYFHDIEGLAKSIDKNGLHQRPLVRPYKGVYQIVHGERRIRAMKLLKWTEIPVIIKEMGDKEAEDARLQENVQRDDLTAMELAWEFKRRIDRGETHQHIADTIQKSKSYVTQRLSLLKLPKGVQEKILKREMSFTEARILLTLRDKEISPRDSVLQQGYARNHLSKRQTETIKAEDLETYRFLKEHKFGEVNRRELYGVLFKDLMEVHPFARRDNRRE